MDLEQFKVTFRLAFPERPEEKLLLLTEKVANVDKTDGMIREIAMCCQVKHYASPGRSLEGENQAEQSAKTLHCMGMLLYLFCDGKTEDNLLGIFNLFDEDGNGTISIDELLNMMAFFIEIGADSGKVDMATVMAEMFQKGDQNKDDKLTKAEFVQGMTGHPSLPRFLLTRPSMPSSRPSRYLPNISTKESKAGVLPRLIYIFIMQTIFN